MVYAECMTAVHWAQYEDLSDAAKDMVQSIPVEAMAEEFEDFCKFAVSGVNFGPLYTQPGLFHHSATNAPLPSG